MAPGVRRYNGCLIPTPPCTEDPVTYRTTLLLDDETRTAMGESALRYDCSTSEAMRAERVRTLERLFELFEGHDADGEIRRLKEEDGGF